LNKSKKKEAAKRGPEPTPFESSLNTSGGTNGRRGGGKKKNVPVLQFIASIASEKKK